MHEVFGFTVPAGDFPNKSHQFSSLSVTIWLVQATIWFCSFQTNKWIGKKTFKNVKKKLLFFLANFIEWRQYEIKHSTWDLLRFESQHKIQWKIVYFMKSRYTGERLCLRFMMWILRDDMDRWTERNHNAKAAFLFGKLPRRQSKIKQTKCIENNS